MSESVVAAVIGGRLLCAGHHTSLMHGWVPVTAQLVAAWALVRVIAHQSRRWRAVWLPSLATLGATTAVVAHWCLQNSGIASEAAPPQVWLWVALSGLAVGAAVAGWPGGDWSRRNRSVFAVAMCLLGVGTAINTWIGYYPTTYAAWNQWTGAPLPDQIDWATFEAMRRSSTEPGTGVLLPVTIDAAASHFIHRDELVYLPPAYFRSDPPPHLPTVMMIGGEFNTPADWIRAGDAVSTLDAFAASHDGNAPAAVFVDSTGAFGNDTECVNGPRGNAADHLVKDVVPYMAKTFGLSADPGDWGVAGFSTGGTCAIDLAVRNPDRFGVFLDIAGDIGPSAGTKTQTIDRLFGGDPQAWSAFDPASVIVAHGHYATLSGLFVVPLGDTDGPGIFAARPTNNGYRVAADTLCELGTAHGIDCDVVTLPGGHVWPFAGAALDIALPWLAGQLHTPGVP